MLTQDDVRHAITWSRVGLRFLSYIHLLLLVAWAAGGLLQGFSNGIFHITPLAYEIIILKILSDALAGGDKRPLVGLGIFLFVVAIGFNITHVVFTIIEISGTLGDLYWFLIVFVVILASLVVLEGIVIYYLIKYKRHLGLKKRK
jgi:hypothetical protein